MTTDLGHVAERLPIVRSAAWVRGALLVGALLGGLAAVNASPDGGDVIGMWPVGLTTAALVLAPRRQRWPLAGVVLVIGVLTVATGRPPGVAAGYGLGLALSSVLVAGWYAPEGTVRPRLRTDGDLARLLWACAGGATVMAAAGLTTSLVTGVGDPVRIAIPLYFTHLASTLTLLPLVSVLPAQAATADQGERVAQWAALLALGVALFTLGAVPVAVVIIIPALAWGALRVTPLEAVAQLLFVLLIALLATSADLGPLADVPQRYDLFADARPALLGLFCVTCALIVIPLTLRVGQQIAEAGAAAGERDVIQRIVDGSHGVAIIVADAEGRITLFNPGAERMLGYTASQVLGRHSSMLHPPGDGEGQRDFERLRTVLAEPRVGATPVRFRHADGSVRVHMLTLSEMHDARGAVTGYVSTSEDVTEQREAQRALEESLRTEREAVERLREVDEVKDALVSSVSHELRTPITSMVGFVELLQDGTFGEPTDGQRYALDRVHANSARLLRLIDDLLVLSRLQAEQVDEPGVLLDLREVARAGAAVVEASTAERDLEVELDLPEQPLPVVGDRDGLERVVVNLLGNAVKFTPDGGRVRVSLREVEGDQVDQLVELDVADTGIGIPAAEHELVFTRFYRASSATRDAVPGTGLGLAITRAVVEAHGGSIAVVPRAAQDPVGTTLRVRLPRAST
ncbi:ATP-binding protein [Nocardioides nanhaiensis]|uniref:histidine kinase n=1 Tax=Nocardioides nanhaiensis TaxID=1476871 RepID=A0ABP8W5I7_9ACTN